MIDVSARENDSTGLVELFYSGTELFFQKLIVNAETCSHLVFDNGTTPVLFDFLTCISKIELNFKRSGIFEIELFFLGAFSSRDVTINFNLLQAQGINGSFYGYDYLYINDEKYTIIKERCDDNSLFLDRPISCSGSLWKGKRQCVTVCVLKPIKDKLVKRILHSCDVHVYKQISIVNLIETTTSVSEKRSLYKLLEC